MGAKKGVEKKNEGYYQGYTFYDLNGKIAYYPSQSNKWTFSVYSGIDYLRSLSKSKNSMSFYSTDRYSTKIDNSFVSIANQRALSPKVFIRNSLHVSSYSNRFSINSLNTGLGDSVFSSQVLRSNINEINVQSRVEYFPSDRHNLMAGLDYSRYTFLPGVETKEVYNNNAGIQMDTAIGYTAHIGANQISAFVEDEMKLGKNCQLNLGIRGAVFGCDGCIYPRLEPRVSLRTMLSNKASAKINYTRMNQFNHLLSSNIMGFEREMWLTSGKEIPPQLSDQFSVGVFYSPPDNKLTISAEAYYKSMKNLVEFHFPATGDVVLTDLDKMVYKNGTGQAYGAEFQVSYQASRVSSTLNYVLSWNNRRFEQLNNGQEYPFLYDRRHNMMLFNQFILNRKFTLNSNFIYSTGTPISLPDAYVNRDSFSSSYYVYTGINKKRLPDYHRLDLAVVKTTTTRRGREQQLTISIYNAYARQNATYIYFKNNKVYQKSMFTILPTISYSLKF
jgi:outer membrane receptor for ferrienterochelin and colicin